MSIQCVVAADQNIPLAKELFSHLGEVRFFSGRELTKSDLLDVDLLMVRSVTHVNAELLEGTSVRFVGTATAGIDHLDTGYLNSKNIHWCSAPGSNARSVAEWVLGSLIELKLLSGENSIKKVALIGHGNAGSAVAKLLSSIGLEVKAYDPFRKDIHTHEPLVELDGLYDADLLSLHIPYTKSGEHPTSEWIDEKFLKCFPKGIHLLNAARGEVVNENDFLKLKNENFFGKVALDVYHNEPNPDVRVLDAADIATQHVAGYSTTGKIRGTQMLLNEAWVYLGNEGEAPKAKNQKNTIDEPITSWKELPHKVYNPLRDAKNLKEKRESNLAEGFDQLRKEYPYRGEYSDFTLVNQSLELKEMAVKLGFNWQD